MLLSSPPERKITLTVKYARSEAPTGGGGRSEGGGNPHGGTGVPVPETGVRTPDEGEAERERRIGEVVIRPRVRKIWYDEGFEESRPGSVRVSLLHDGAVREEAVLSPENDWQHVWETAVYEEGDWSVLEEVPEGYAFTVSRDGAEYLVCNYAGVRLPGTPAQLVPADDGTGDKKLPQTGLLRWPAAVLGILGMLFIWIGRRKAR